MGHLRRIVLARHGETIGESRQRLLGSSDVALSEQGRAGLRRFGGRLGGEAFDVVVASPVSRSWKSASLAAPGARVRLEPDFREIHYGRWEGLTREEIQARDPVLHQEWVSGSDGFEFPGGEARSEFRGRVRTALAGLLALPVNSALVVADPGVLAILAEELAGEKLGDGEPAPGEGIELTRKPDGTWFRGRRSSNPAGVDSSVFV